MRKAYCAPLMILSLEGEELEVLIIRRSFKGFREEASRYRFEIDRDLVEEFVEERR